MIAAPQSINSFLLQHNKGSQSITQNEEITIHLSRAYVTISKSISVVYTSDDLSQPDPRSPATPPNMAPTESTILANYLLVPAQLPAIISLKEFTDLFPRAQQASPQVKGLYRDLQIQRNALIDAVASNIETEAKRAKALRREVLRAKREAEDREIDDEIDIERAVGFPLPLVLAAVLL